MASDDWREIPGYEGLYWITDSGRIKNRKGHELKPRPVKGTTNSGTPYMMIGLSKNKKVRQETVHRLIAKTFIGPPPSPKHVVDHIDGNPLNNSVENLRWVTQSENRRWVEGRRDLKIEELEKENEELKQKIEKLEKKLEGEAK